MDAAVRGVGGRSVSPGDALQVDLGALQASAELRTEQRIGIRRIAQTVQSATASGNLFGLLGRMTGLDDSYQNWVHAETDALTELDRMVGDLAAGLIRTVEVYAATDRGVEELAIGLRAMLDSAVTGGPAGATP